MPPRFFQKALSEGRCVVCLDGLDEVWSIQQRKLVIDAVRALSTKYPHNHYVISSRIIGYEEASLSREEFAHYTLSELSDEDINVFIRNWYKLREPDSSKRKQAIESLIETISN